jgi:hypothetical protein|tara:strand:+ start:153 stop:329 length:177 start_codon:yes stop_codon:yes gene_type:complete
MDKHIQEQLDKLILSLAVVTEWLPAEEGQLLRDEILNNFISNKVNDYKFELQRLTKVD